MARTDTNTANSKRIKSPVKRYITFSGSAGNWSYWDGENDVEFDTLEFVLCETRQAISGWSEEKGGRINSNLVSNTKDTLVVRCKTEILYKGTYADGKAEINALGGSFTTVLFGIGRSVKTDDQGIPVYGEWEPMHIQLAGSSLSAWLEFTKNNPLREIYKKAITASRGDQQKKGAVKYYMPVFTLFDPEAEVFEQADEFTVTELKPYLEQ